MTMPGISGSTPQGGGVSLRCFGEGRLVLVFPLREETGHAFGKPSEPKQFMKCNVVMLPDGAPSITLPTKTIGPLPPFITFGGEADNSGGMKKPDTMRIDVGPAGTLFENLSIGGGGMLYILRKALSANQGRVGRLWKDPAYDGAWKLTEVADGTPEMAAAVNWFAAFSSGNFVNPAPMPLPQIPQQQAMPQQPAQQGWAQQNVAQQPPAAPQQGWGAQPAAPVNAAPPAQQGWGAPAVQQNPAQPAQGWGAPAQQGWGAPQPVAPAAAEPPTGF